MEDLDRVSELQAWIAASRLHVSWEGNAASFSALEGVRVRRVASDRYLVALVAERDASPMVGLANHDSCRVICKTAGLVIPDEGVDLVYGSAPLFGLNVDELPSLTQEEYRPVIRPTDVRVLTTSAIPGRTITDTVGMVTGSTVRARHLGAKIVAGVSQNFGGELGGYTRLLQEARDEAVTRMLNEARALGADAVVGFRLATADLFDQAIEMLAYGTAVRTIDAIPDV